MKFHGFSMLSLLGAIALPSCAAPPSAPSNDIEGATAEAAQALTECVTIQRGALGNAEDAHLGIEPSRYGKNYGASQGFSTGVVSGGGTRQALLSFDLSPIPPGSTIDSAAVRLSVLLNGGGAVDVHTITAPWSEATVTYNSFGSAYDPAVAAVIPGATAGNTTSVDLTALVTSWYDGTTPNYGVLLDETGGGLTTYIAGEHPASSMRPALDVCYTTGQCYGQPDGAACDDNDACTPTDTCQSGLCVGSGTTDTTTGLSHFWSFDEAGTSPAIDSVGGATGTLGSSASRTLSFDGSNAVIMTPTAKNDMNAHVDFGMAPGQVGAADYTVSYWMQSSYNTAGTHGDVLGNRTNASAGPFFGIRLLGAGTMSFEQNQSTSGLNGVSVGTSPTIVNDGQWHHVAITRSGTLVTFYVDGVAVNSNNSAAPTNIVPTASFRLGRRLPSTFSNFYSLPIAFDNLRIYKGRALVACEVASLHTTP